MKFKDRIDYLKKLKKDYQIELDENGRSLIDVTVRDENSILSSFSSKNPIISNELVEYLDYKLSPSVIKNGLHMDIKCESIEKENEMVYESAIKNYYKDLLISKTNEVNKMAFISLIFFLLGALILIATVILELQGINVIAIELYDIIAWVFVWEATDIFFLQRPIVNYEKNKCFEVIDAIVTFSK